LKEKEKPTMATSERSWTMLLAVAWVLTMAPGCSLKRIAINSVAGVLTESGETFAADDDPELIRDAVPFSLKLVESLLADVPKHRGLLLTACSGFTQYAYAFVDLDAEMLKLEDYARHAKLQDRARKMYLRGRDYCLRSLEIAHPGITARLTEDPDRAVAVLHKTDVPLMYWTGAAWGKAVALSLDRPAIPDGPSSEHQDRRAPARVRRLRDDDRRRADHPGRGQGLQLVPDRCTGPRNAD
jgi:hypothetical protein